MNETLATGRGASGGSILSLDERIVETLVREFAASWRQGVEKINDSVLSYFSNFKTGMDILKQVLQI